jgi:hypothetical protein
LVWCFYLGEQVRLVISAQNALGAIMPATRGSYLQLPIKTA